MNRDKKPPVITQVHVSKTENPLGSCSIMNDVKKSEEAVPYPRDNRCPRNSNVRSSSFTATILLLRWWLPELFASCLSILSFISLIILVNNYQGRPIQDTNLPPSLTLNGLIALLSTIVRASLMVPVGSALSQVIWLSLCSKGGRRVVDLECADGASRGSWGSLLWLLRAKRGWLANAAAAVTLVSLAFGTFTQQLLAIVNTQVEDPALNPGNIPRTESWRNSTGRASQGQNAVSAPLTMRAATYSGILTPTVQSPDTLCPLGNCTWPITPSLAVCGSCTPSEFQKSCNATAYGRTQPLGESRTTYPIPLYPSVCKVTLPSGLQANLSNVPEDSEGIGFQVFTTPGARWNSSDNDRAYVANFEMVGFEATADGEVNGGRILPETPVVAYECALWMCVKSYRTEMVAGVQIQTVEEEFSDIREVEGLSLDQYFLPLPATMNPRPGANFTIGDIAKYSMQRFLERIFNGNVSVTTGSQIPSSDVTSAMWLATLALDTWVENLASSMTNVVRTTLPQPDGFYDGTGYQLAYQIRWAWLALPALLVLASLVILGSVIVQTTRSPAQAWKGSPLALIFIKVEGSLQRRVAHGIDAYQGIEMEIGKSKVKVDRAGDDGWMLKGS